jgi:hypothetical protein
VDRLQFLAVEKARFDPDYHAVARLMANIEAYIKAPGKTN